MRKSLWSAFMTLTLVAIAIVGCMMMFSGGKEIASSGRDATLIREIDNATIMDVHDYDYLRGLDDYESYAEEVQSAIDYDDTQSERIESAALGTAPKVQHASGVESRSERVARRRATSAHAVSLGLTPQRQSQGSCCPGGQPCMWQVCDCDCRRRRC